jgi:hypothetical protein
MVASSRTAAVPMPIKAVRVVTTTLVLAASWIAPAAGLHGQGGAPERATITGVVRDGVTGAPVVAAAVRLAPIGRATVTDSEGAFRMTDVPAGTYEWTVVAIGYVPLTQEVELADGDHFNIGLMPRPLMMEGVSVDVPRMERLLERRRRAAATSIRVFRQDQLLAAGAATVHDLVTQRAMLRLCPVDDDLFGGLPECVLSRGRLIRPRVYVDERQASLIELYGYQPAEIYAVELWAGGQVVRVYTRQFAERLASGRASLRPRDF